MSSSSKPYACHPQYADVEYIDGKLGVARTIVATTTNDRVRANWQKTVDILLDQRSMLASVTEEVEAL